MQPGRQPSARRCLCGCMQPVDSAGIGPYATESCRRAHSKRMLARLRAYAARHTFELHRTP
jgi:hypothetical protein